MTDLISRQADNEQKAEESLLRTDDKSVSKDDVIYRADAIDAVLKGQYSEDDSLVESVEECNSMIEWAADVLKNLPSAQPEQQHGRIFQEIVIEYPSISVYPEYKGKPYFSIKYTENGQGFIGYGTYKPEVLSEYLIKYFMSSAQPEVTEEAVKEYCRKRCLCIVDSALLKKYASAQPIIRCKDCRYHEQFFHEDKRRKEGGYYIFGCELADGYSHVCLDDDYCSRAERRTDEADYRKE